MRMTEPWSSSLELTVPSVSGNGAGQEEKALPLSGQEMSTLPDVSLFQQAESKIISCVSLKETATSGQEDFNG